jgi:hypothetical protein
MLDAEARLDRLHRRLADALATLPDAEVILVDDGSADGTWDAVVRLAAEDDRVRGLRLAENVGQTGALCAGFSIARGEVVVMMDDDLEGDTGDLVRFVDAVRAGADFASGWRVGPRQPVRTAGSWLYNLRLRSWGLPFHDAGCGVNGLSLPLARQLAADGWDVHQHRFKPRVAHHTDRIVEIRFPVRRTEGSHHSLTGLAASWLDVEMTVGGLGRDRVVAAGIVAPTAVALVAAALPSPSRRGRGLVAVVAGAVAVMTARLLARRDALVRRAASSPPFVVAERVGDPPSTSPPVAPSSPSPF